MRRRVRILHLHSGNLRGGIESNLMTLVRGRAFAPQLEHRFALCFEGWLSAQLAAGGSPALQLPAVRARRPWTIWHARRRLRAIIRDAQPDIALTHAPWSHAMLAPAVRRAGLPLAFWLHGPVDGRHWLERWASLTPPDLVLCNSHFTAGTAARLFPNTRCEVIRPPVVAPSADAVAHRAALRAQFETPPRATVIIHVSRLDPPKGQDVLLRALAGLDRDAPEWRCWLVGGAQRPAEIGYLARLKDEARALGIADRVHFLGQREDVAALLAAADVFCQANYEPEGFGIVFVEAMAAGIPVVTTELGAALEVVERSCGLLVPPQDPAALTRALDDLLRNPERRAAMGVAGRRHAAQLCDPATQFGHLAEAFGGLLPPPLAPPA
jgi:glycosyltransferase involved in cell wall biosynthesis